MPNRVRFILRTGIRDSGLGVRNLGRALLPSPESRVPHPEYSWHFPQLRDVPVLSTQQADAYERYENGGEPKDRDIRSAPPAPSATDPRGEKHQVNQPRHHGSQDFRVELPRTLPRTACPDKPGQYADAQEGQSQHQ